MARSDIAGTSTTSRMAEKGKNIVGSELKWKNIEKRVDSRRWTDKDKENQRKIKHNGRL